MITREYEQGFSADCMWLGCSVVLVCFIKVQRLGGLGM